MTLLWLDDVRDPAHLGLHDWLWVKTVDEAIAVLDADPLEIVFASLDHDLGGLVFVPSDSGEETGYTLVKWMEENNRWPVSGCSVHSANPTGKEAMQQVIERHYGRRFYPPKQCWWAQD
jgi:hypothetical protein